VIKRIADQIGKSLDKKYPDSSVSASNVKENQFELVA